MVRIGTILLSFLIELFVLYGQSCFAQGSVSRYYLLRGKVLNAKTGQPIEYASVYFIKRANGVLTDSLGSFQYMEEITYPDTIKIMSLGYETGYIPYIPVKDNNILIKLQPSLNELEEVKVTSAKSDPYEIMRKAIANLGINHAIDTTCRRYECFIRSTNKDSVLFQSSHVTNIIYTGKKMSDMGLSQTVSTKWYKRNYNYNDIGFVPMYGNTSFAPRIDFVRYSALFNTKKLKHFDLVIDSYLPLNDSTGIYVIRFYTNQLRYAITNAFYERAFSGTVYIRSDDYAVTECHAVWLSDTATLNRHSQKYFQDRNIDKTNFKNAGYWNKLYTEKSVILNVRYKKSSLGKYYLEYGNYQWYEQGMSRLNNQRFEISTNMELYRNEANDNCVN